MDELLKTIAKSIESIAESMERIAAAEAKKANIMDASYNSREQEENDNGKKE